MYEVTKAMEKLHLAGIWEDEDFNEYNRLFDEYKELAKICHNENNVLYFVSDQRERRNKELKEALKKLEEQKHDYYSKFTPNKKRN